MTYQKKKVAGTVGSTIEWKAPMDCEELGIKCGEIYSAEIKEVDIESENYTVCASYGTDLISWNSAEVTIGSEIDYSKHFTEDEISNFKKSSFNFPHLIVDESDNVIRIEEIVSLGGGGKGKNKNIITSIGIQVHEKGKKTKHRFYNVEEIEEGNYVEEIVVSRKKTIESLSRQLTITIKVIILMAIMMVIMAIVLSK